MGLAIVFVLALLPLLVQKTCRQYDLLFVKG